MLIVGERINASRKTIAQAIAATNKPFIQEEAKTQTLAGAHYIDVNAGTFVGEEREKLRWVVEAVQEVTDLPLSIDSADPKVIEAIIPFLKRTPMINSINLEPSRYAGLLPLVLDYKPKIIALCQAETAMVDTAEEKVVLAGRLVERLTAAGVPLDDIYLDPIVFPLATNPQSARATLNAIEEIMRRFRGVHTICGLTNVSYGLPSRKTVNKAFLAAAIAKGLDAAIIDPTDKLLYGILKAATLVAGRDNFCRDYISAFREGRIE